MFGLVIIVSFKWLSLHPVFNVAEWNLGVGKFETGSNWALDYSVVYKLIPYGFSINADHKPSVKEWVLQQKQ